MTIALTRLMVTAALLASPGLAFADPPTAAMATLAQNSAASAPAAQTDAKALPATGADKKICKQLPSSYSRMTQRTCLTAKEWKQIEQDSQE